MADKWTPAVGEEVVYSAYSTITGKLVNRRIECVTKRTKAGFVYITGARASKFQCSGEAGSEFVEWIPRQYWAATVRSYIRSASTKESKILPRDNLSGNNYAKKLDERRASWARGDA